jgi:hypothetical protein
MSTCVEEDLFHARVGKELEGVFDERGIGEWE